VLTGADLGQMRQVASYEGLRVETHSDFPMKRDFVAQRFCSSGTGSKDENASFFYVHYLWALELASKQDLYLLCWQGQDADKTSLRAC